jgi:GDP-mannose 6-dehydrogenase
MFATASKPRVVIIGLGYVGSVAAACLAAMGYCVAGVDREPAKVQSVLGGDAPFFEPGLADVIRAALEAGRLSATTGLAGVLDSADVAFVCVGTPCDSSGAPQLGQLYHVSNEIAACARERSKPLIVAVRSTVLPGTCAELSERFFKEIPAVRVVANPEFLREGNAVRDFLEPSLIVVGGDDPASVQAIARIYAPLGVAPCLVSFRCAETIKYACNAFHAMKIDFANEVGSFASRVGVDAAEVLNILCRDTRLNISAAYMRPGFAFGGSCLPKDLRTFMHCANRLQIKLPLIDALLQSNDEHLLRIASAAEALPEGPIAIFGLSFKENTDDLRESPSISLIQHLIDKGRHVRVFDPQIQFDRIVGTNLRFLLDSLPHVGRLFVKNLDELLDGAGSLIITQQAAPGVVARLRSAGIPTLDFTNHDLTPEPVALHDA